MADNKAQLQRKIAFSFPVFVKLAFPKNKSAFLDQGVRGTPLNVYNFLRDSPLSFGKVGVFPTQGSGGGGRPLRGHLASSIGCRRRAAAAEGNPTFPNFKGGTPNKL